MENDFQARFPIADKLKDVDEVNVKFISGTIPFSGSIHINPAYWTLKSHYARHGKNNHKINWLECIHYNVGLCENEITRIINEEKPHIICFGLYIWNHDLYGRLGRFIRKQWPDIILLGGGPEIYAHKEPDLFWKNNEWLDAVAYGDGESAFTVMLDNIVQSSDEIETATNISYLSQGKPVLEPFKRFKDIDFNHVSPFLDNMDLVKHAVDTIRKKDPSLEIIMNWEFTKGCPYTCSFCDWSSGLHHKVNRKQHDWRIDLDFFASLGVSVRWVDANIGMFKDDINVVRHAFDLENANPDFKFTFNNLAKLNKKAVFEIIDFIESAKPGVKTHAMTVQDIHADVLENIQRPDIPWEEYREYISRSKEKNPSFRFTGEMMLGLPGQTIEKCATNIIEFGKLGAENILGHVWCMLINSPGYNSDYREKYGIKTVPALHISNIPNDMLSRDDILSRIDDCEYYAAETVVGTNSCDLGDIMAMNGMIMLYNSMISIIGKVDMRVLERALSNTGFWRSFGEDIAVTLEKDYEKHGKMLLIPDVDGRPTPFGQYFGDRTVIADIIKRAYKTY